MIRTEKLSFSYGNNEILRNIDLHIEKGSFTVILGRNGSGKSTLAKHFNAILLPSGGAVYVKNTDTKNKDEILNIRRTVQMVFQNPDNQAVAAIVENEIAFAPENLGVPFEEIRRRVNESLAAMNMTKYAKSAVANLSGGQKQLIAIAAALAANPECIVLDEPTAMLDPKNRAAVISAIHSLNREKGITVVLITHYMEEAVDADRVIVTDNGKIALDNTPREIFKNADMIKALGLDVPQPAELMNNLRKNGFDVREDILTADEAAAEIIKILGESK